MSRMARVVVINYPYHITQRGNYKQNTFEDKTDYEQYLIWLEKYKNKYGLLVLAYCLMPNHVHFIAVPTEENSLAKTFNICHMRYSQYFNRKKRLAGHLWQGRFYSCALDEKHLYAAVKYVETNPIRARLVKNPKDWEWSSAKFHTSEKHGILTLMNAKALININNWEQYLSQDDDEKITSEIKKSTLTGRPSGTIAFVRKFEKLINRKLISLGVGRPKK